MALKCNFNENQIAQATQEQAEMLYDGILQSFIRAGLKFVKDAREQVQDHSLGTYEDDTKNLRNSIGFFIFRNGQLITDDAGPALSGVSEKIGDLIKPEGIQLIGIAGMNYASHVESKGYNVISYQADQCIVDLTLYMQDLKLVKEGSAAALEETFIP